MMCDDEKNKVVGSESLTQAILENSEITRAILETAVDAIITIDQHALIESFNPAAERIFGYRAEELIGKNIKQLMPQPYQAEHDSYIQNYITTGEKKIIGIGREVSGLRKDGSEFPLELAVSEVRLNGRRLFTGIVRDITERKAVENALQREINTRKCAEAALRTSNRYLETKAEELMQVTRLKSEFLANMSHELRTPMNSIIGFTGRVIKKAGDQLAEKQLNNLRIVQRNANHLLQLINDILDLSKIEAGKLELFIEQASVNEIIRDVAELNSSLAVEKKLTLNIQLPSEALYIDTDSTKLKQILINLVGNAVKFTEQGSITISVEKLDSIQKARLPQLSKHEQDYLMFSVKDTGIGISQEELAYIFSAFRQADGSLTRNTGGTGLGLTITERLVKLLGGIVQVSSNKNEGSTFSVIIPFNGFKSVKNTGVAVELKRYLPTHAMSKSGRLSVLCIDDDPEVLVLLQSILNDEGFDVVSALTGDEGIRLAQEKAPAIITLDIVMPDKDGWSVLRELKQDQRTQHIPVIVVSFSDNRSTVYKLGATDFIAKPITPEKLQPILSQLATHSPENILAVDDDSSTLELILQLFEDEPVQITTASNGRQALEKIKASSPDVILLDLMMPEMDGFEVIRQLQSDQQYQHIPIFVLTAKELDDAEYDFLNARVKSIIRKEGQGLQDMLIRIVKNIRQLTNIPLIDSEDQVSESIVE